MKALLAAALILAVVVALTLYADAHAERLGPRHTVQSTAYSPCDGSGSAGLMADGHRVRWGAVANNFLPLGTRIRLDRPVTAHRPDGVLVRRRLFTIEDRIGWGSQLDIWMPRCADMNAWGRRTVSFRTVVR